MSDIVKPCPFCGASPECSHSNGAAQIWCSNDECENNGFVDSKSPYIDDVIKKWNRRNSEDEIKRLNKENTKLREALEFYADTGSYEYANAEYCGGYARPALKKCLEDVEHVYSDEWCLYAGKRARKTLEEIEKGRWA